MLLGEQNQPLAMQLIPLVTLWPLLTQFQHTVWPSMALTIFGTKARPCPTVTFNTGGGICSHGVLRGRGVGVGLAGAICTALSRAIAAARNGKRIKAIRIRMSGFIKRKLRARRRSRPIPATRGRSCRGCRCWSNSCCCGRC